MRVLNASALAHAATGEDREAVQRTVFEVGDNSDVISVNVGGVVARKGKTNLELTR
jgi:hypothetical protein